MSEKKETTKKTSAKTTKTKSNKKDSAIETPAINVLADKSELFLNNVYGIVGVVAINSNFNADLTGRPRTLPDGKTYYSSDKAFKYAVRFYLKCMQYLIFNYRNDMLNKVKGKVYLMPKTLKENYEDIFNVADLSKVTDMTEVLINLFSCQDVRFFGTTFAETGKNTGIRGVAQIYQGINIYECSEEITQEMIAPYRNPSDKGEEALSTSIGSRVFLNEAHYAFPFSVNPCEYEKWVKKGVMNGFTKKDYDLLQECFRHCATALTSTAKAGCENEYAIFVKIKEDKKFYLPNLTRYIRFEKNPNGDGKDKLVLGFNKLLKSLKDKIESVEVYYNQYLLDIEFDYDDVVYKDIFSGEEIEILAKA